MASDLRRLITHSLIPRSGDHSRPVLAVIAGSTGSGKSTIVNSLVGADISPVGIVRPTTATPVVVCHPDDLDWFITTTDPDGLLPDMPRSIGAQPESGHLHLVASSRLPSGLALIDAPDIDSVVTSHHELAGQLIDSADVWLIVTTAHRYADAAPWVYLRRAGQRRIRLGVVVNRLPGDGGDTIIDHLTAQLATDEVAVDTMVTIPELQRHVGGHLDSSLVAPIAAWLMTIVTDRAHNNRFVTERAAKLDVVVAEQVNALAVELEAHHAIVDHLHTLSHRHYDRAQHEMVLGRAVEWNTAPLERWSERVTGMTSVTSLKSGTTLISDKVGSVATGRLGPTSAAVRRLIHNLEVIVHHALDTASARTLKAWTDLDDSLDGRAGADLTRSDLSRQIIAILSDWAGSVRTMVKRELGGITLAGQSLAWGSGDLALAVMLVTLASPRSSTGSAVVGAAHHVVDAVFDDETTSSLIHRSERSLDGHLTTLFDAERSRHDRLVDPGSVSPARLREWGR